MMVARENRPSMNDSEEWRHNGAGPPGHDGVMGSGPRATIPVRNRLHRPDATHVEG